MKRREIVMAVAMVAATLVSCEQKAPRQDTPVRRTMIVEAKRQELLTEYSATLRGLQMVEIRPQVSGLITRILIAEGQKVRRGQLLFEIDAVPYEAALRTARAALQAARAVEASAQIDYNSRQTLHSNHVVSDIDLQTSHQALLQAQARVAEAEAQVANAENSLSYTRVKSPVDGVAGMIPWHVGALVGSNITEPLVTVSDDAQMHAYFSMSERDVTDLAMRQGGVDQYVASKPVATLRLANGKAYDQQGHVDAVSGVVDQGTGSVSLRATFPNPDHLLRNGGSATVVLPTMRDSVLVIPLSATYELQNRVFAYRVEDGKAKSAPIEITPTSDGSHCIVEHGLKAGDVIIAEGAGLVREGEAVK